MSRETRLLLVTIGISVLLLFLLARFRFPQPPAASPQGPVVAPLDRILARDVLGDVSTALRTLEPVVTRAVVALRVATDDEATGLGEKNEHPGPRTAVVPALRLRDDLAIALLPPGARVRGTTAAASETPSIVGTDIVRGLALVRVAKQAAPTLSLAPPVDGRAAVMVAVVGGSVAGPLIRPALPGQAGQLRDPRWPSPLLVLDRKTTPVGAFVFTLDGSLAGLVVDSDGDAALVPAAELVEAGEALIGGRPPRAGDLGVEVQPLTGTLADATGAAGGVVVRTVDPGGPAHDLLRPGDVIIAVDDLPVDSPVAFERHVVALRAGVSARVAIIRLGDQLTITFAARDRPEPPPAQPAGPLGVKLALAAGVGARVAGVARGSPADVAGVRSSDLITQIDASDAPTPDQVERAWAAAPAGGALLVVVSRAGTQLVLAIRKP